MSRFLYCCLFFCLLTTTALAQPRLATARRSSYFTKVFRLTDAQTRQLYQKGLAAARPEFFTQVVDSFPTDSSRQLRRLPGGHYLVAHAEAAQLVYWLHPVTDRTVAVLDNQTDLLLTVRDTLGRLLPGAEVRLHGRRLPYDSLTRIYRRPRHGRAGLLAVTWQGRTTYHPLERSYKGASRMEYALRQVYARVVWNRPLGYLTVPLYNQGRYLVREVSHLLKGYGSDGEAPGLLSLLRSPFSEDVRDDRENWREQQREYTSPYDWTGYALTSQPRYRPHGDTLRLKARIVRRSNGRPSRRPLRLTLHDDHRDQDRTILLRPSAPGTYVYTLPITDSLGWGDDTDVQFTLANRRGYQRMKGRFSVEDYELPATRYTLRTLTKTHYQGQPQAFFVRGRDFNDLSLLDARVRLALVPERVSELGQPTVFVPDTLWTHAQALDPVGETRIDLPAKVLPAVALRYKVLAVFLNADQERHVEQTSVEYSLATERLRLQARQDSIVADYELSGHSLPGMAELEILGTDTTAAPLFRGRVTLPLARPLDTRAALLRLQDAAGHRTRLNLQRTSANVELRWERRNDSLLIAIDNPRRLPCWYFVYRRNRLVQRGYGVSPKLVLVAGGPTVPWQVSLHYQWAGKPQVAEYSLTPDPRVLTVQTDLPTAAYPGQRLHLRYTVTDATGQPVPNADLATFAYNARFEKPTLRQINPAGRVPQGRRSLRRFQLPGFASQYNKPEKQPLRWSRWQPQLGLDSLTFYHFLFPKAGLFTEYRPAPGGITQFAPFVVDSGRIDPVQAVWLDKVPLYIAEINQDEPYSLPADSGRHTLVLRTATRLLTYSDLRLRAGQKLTISLDVNQHRADMLIEKRPDHFTPLEALELQRTLLPLEELGRPTNRRAVLVQGERRQLLGPSHRATYWNGRTLTVAGPLRPDSLRYVSAAGWERSFVPEPGYYYGLALDQMRLTSHTSYNFSRFYPPNHFSPDTIPLRGFALTEAAAAWLQRRQVPDWAQRQLLFERPYATAAGQGRLEIRLAPELAKALGPASLGWLQLTRPDQPNFECLQSDLYPLHALEPGRYKLRILLADSSLLVPNAGIEVRPDGLTIVQLGLAAQQPAGAASRALRRHIARRVLEEWRRQNPPASQSQQLHRQPFGGWNRATQTIRGRVIDKSTNEGLPGVSVIVKGTTTGTATNADGDFSLDMPPGMILQFKYLGYITKERPATGEVQVGLDVDTKQLNEVVVTALGVPREKRAMGYATATISGLAGRVAGVNVLAGSSSRITIRGNSSMSGNPLFIVDGIPQNGSMSDLDPKLIADIQVLKGAAAVALYGSNAADGVVVITTKPGTVAAATPLLPTAPAADAGAALRRHFRDYAWWRPTLLTNARGQASTDVVLPDDMTAWDAFALASDRRGRSGEATTRLHSFKALRAELALPRFLVASDQTHVLGKVLNYLPDTVQVSTSFRVGDGPARTQTHRVSTAVIDTLTVTAPAAADSLRLTFSMRQTTGYEDGEQRTMPLVPAGTRETVGSFALLAATDTTLTLPVAPGLGEVQLRLEADALPTLQREIEHLGSYAYLCNEQLASKLLALLLQQRIRQHQQQAFTQESEVYKLIRRLQAGRQPMGLWGTWSNAAPSAWVSLHALEALLQARQQGFGVQLDQIATSRFLTAELDEAFAAAADRSAYPSRPTTSPLRAADDRVRLLNMLRLLEVKLDYASYLDRLDREPGRPSLDQQLARLELRQALRLPAALDALHRYRFATQLGGVFYADTTHAASYFRYLLPERIGTTLQAYRLLRATGAPAAELQRIRAFLLNQRSNGHWASTYESASILATIGPDLLPTTSPAPTTVQLSGPVGAAPTTISTFPYVATRPAGAGPLTLRKQGTLPVYATAYQTHWNSNPKAVAAAFSVRSTLAGQAGPALRLRPGQPAELLVEVEVKAEARYVLVEVPIPAGCSYGPPAPTNPLETHREYLRQQVGIFIDNLPVGTYKFRIALQPRYAGRYTLNPARAELVYFPTRFGRSDSKRVVVE